MTVLAHLAPPGPELPRTGWECPRCLTVYNPDVKACHCAAKKPLSERIDSRIYESGPVPYRATLPACTCPVAWGGLCPPPACPVHGQTEMLQVRC